MTEQTIEPSGAVRSGPVPSGAISSGAYLEVRALTDQLAEPLSGEDQTVQSMPDVSPTKWHRGHTSWFFETFVLQPGVAGYQACQPAYSYLFNSYYEALGARHPRGLRGVISRPGVDEVTAYRRHVDQAMVDLLEEPEGPRTAGQAATVELGLHHEHQHQELLLMDIKHVLWCNPLLPAYRPPSEGGADRLPGRPGEPMASGAPTASSAWVEHPGGLVEVGHGGEGFAFDNEAPRHAVHLEAFALAPGLVTSGHWAEFIEDGGYRRSELWLSDGWARAQAEGWDSPLYWHQDPAGWKVFTLGGPMAMDPSEPVCHVSYYEADAFARWAGARLPTEAEWEVVAAEQGGTGGLLDLDVLHPRPRAGAGDQARLLGDVWQWTSSSYSAYPGFRPAPGAVGEYNGKFMVGQQVLRGGSCLTPPGHARVTYRNFFPPSARWAVSGLRLAQDG